MRRRDAFAKMMPTQIPSAKPVQTPVPTTVPTHGRVSRQIPAPVQTPIDVPERSSVPGANQASDGSGKPGFTLIEMLIVVALTGILALIAYPSYRNAVLKSRRAEGRAALSAAMLEQERWFTSHNSYQSFAAGTPNGFRWYSGASAIRSAYELEAAACPGEVIANCVLIAAQPGTTLVNTGHQDPECGQLTLDSSGQRGAGGPLQVCW